MRLASASQQQRPAAKAMSKLQNSHKEEWEGVEHFTGRLALQS